MGVGEAECAGELLCSERDAVEGEVAVGVGAGAVEGTRTVILRGLLLGRLVPELGRKQ